MLYWFSISGEILIGYKAVFYKLCFFFAIEICNSFYCGTGMGDHCEQASFAWLPLRSVFILMGPIIGFLMINSHFKWYQLISEVYAFSLTMYLIYSIC